MVKREIHSHNKQASDPDDDELLTEGQITDSEFLESVYGRQLRVFARTLFKDKTYGGDGPDDLVQRAIGSVVDGGPSSLLTSRSGCSSVSSDDSFLAIVESSLL